MCAHIRHLHGENGAPSEYCCEKLNYIEVELNGVCNHCRDPFDVFASTAETLRKSQETVSKTQTKRKKESYPMEKKKNFWAGTGGRITITAVSVIVIWGLLVLLITLTTSHILPQEITLVLLAGITILLTYFGWKALNKIQPSIFLFMPLIGWFIYFVAKWLLSMLVGSFVAPFVIGKKIADKVHESIQSKIY